VLDVRELQRDADAVARRMINHRTRWQVPGVADGESVLLTREAPDQSAMLVRMRSRRPTSQMPPLGTVMADRVAVEALRTWIGSVDRLTFSPRDDQHAPRDQER
jgi:hypothetical protein